MKYLILAFFISQVVTSVNSFGAPSAGSINTIPFEPISKEVFDKSVSDIKDRIQEFGLDKIAVEHIGGEQVAFPGHPDWTASVKHLGLNDKITFTHMHQTAAGVAHSQHTVTYAHSLHPVAGIVQTGKTDIAVVTLGPDHTVNEVVRGAHHVATHASGASDKVGLILAATFGVIGGIATLFGAGALISFAAKKIKRSRTAVESNFSNGFQTQADYDVGATEPFYDRNRGLQNVATNPRRY